MNRALSCRLRRRRGVLLCVRKVQATADEPLGQQRLKLIPADYTAKLASSVLPGGMIGPGA
jgi:hypothetical protein